MVSSITAVYDNFNCIQKLIKSKKYGKQTKKKKMGKEHRKGGKEKEVAVISSTFRQQMATRRSDMDAESTGEMHRGELNPPGRETGRKISRKISRKMDGKWMGN